MPFDPRPRRRSLLATGAAGAAALLLTGCSQEEPTAAERRLASAGERLRGAAARGSAALLARYDRTLAAHPDLAERLRPLRADVARHVRAFGGTEPGASASPKTSGSPRASAGTGGPPAPDASRSAESGVPADPGRALSALANAERAAADALTRALDGAPPELARLFASVAAAGAVHVYLLTDGE
ncbi:hypothetical protein L7D48_09155 [Streptomyces sp. S1A]|uniref:hypothetical protein n=1 Tax=Streptomyces sp. ICN903 TaxID=2964654 RepID=UPI001EDB9FFD|nr:hypothetical protein [Streptomyces sp. ICN903]MCG3040732.1 hypothetical protein [Streptomyces sp. ICN903]